MIDYALEQQPGQWRVRCNQTRLHAHQFYEALSFEAAKSQTVFHFFHLNEINGYN